MHKLIQLFYMIFYASVSQLYWRIWYLCKRRVLQNRLSAVNQLKRWIAPTVSRVELPCVESPAAHACTVHDDKLDFIFVNETVSFPRPMNFLREFCARDHHLWLFNLHYMEYLAGVSDEVFIELVTLWIDQVRPYGSGYWLSGWSAYTLSLRVVVWMQQYQRRYEHWPESFKRKLLDSLFQQLQFLQSNLERDISGNHLIKNIKALIVGGRFFEGEQAADMYRSGLALLQAVLAEQVLADGFHYERSPSYHCQVFQDFIEIYPLLETTMQSQLRPVLDNMANVMEAMTHPNGFIALFGDGGQHMSPAPESLLAALPWTRSTKRAALGILDFSAAGYYGYKSENVCLWVDAGKIAPDNLPAHGHGDIGSFELSVFGRDVFVDQGTFQYAWGASRKQCKATASHNALVIDGEDQAVFFGAFRMGRRPRSIQAQVVPHVEGVEIKLAHDAYKHCSGAPVHHRSFLLRGNQLEVNDRVVDGRGQKVQIHFLLHPEIVVVCEGEEIVLDGESWRATISTQRVAVVQPAVWWPDFGVERQTKRITIEIGPAPCEHQLTMEWVSKE